MSSNPNNSSSVEINPLRLAGSLALAGLAGAGLATLYFTKLASSARRAGYSIGDQVARFNAAKAANNARVLDIDQYFDKSVLSKKRVLVIGASRGLGLRIARELVSIGAETIAVVRKPCSDLEGCQVIEGIDVTKYECMDKLVEGLEDRPVDVVICNAGYFYGPVERVTDDSINFEEEMKMIDICGLGPLRVVSGLINKGKRCLINPNGGKVAIITSQAGSIAWRQEQNKNGDNYGHHASRAVTNMIGRLLSFELGKEGNDRDLNINVAMLHPGFNRTDMTKKYQSIWDEEGAVEPEIGAKRVLHEINRLGTQTESGSFVNCEDGLLIPW